MGKNKTRSSGRVFCVYKKPFDLLVKGLILKKYQTMDALRTVSPEELSTRHGKSAG